ncbi:MAG: YdcF family protein [Bacteroidales bacterium]|nr:YdcF family protein [Bacteroidales bacterium]
MKYLAKIVKVVFFAFGGLFLSMVVLAFTSVPFYSFFRLGQNPDKEILLTHPQQVVMFGGAGMPSEDNLMRLYHTAALARHFEVPVLLVHPEDSLCQAEMTRLLHQGGIDSVRYMTSGANTRSQVVELMEAYPELTEEELLVVTSPEHVRRTLKCLQKAGFTHVVGKAAYPATVNFDLSLKKQKLGGNEMIPAVENVKIRYTFFNYLKLEITCIREYLSLGYYKIKGWI